MLPVIYYVAAAYLAGQASKSGGGGGPIVATNTSQTVNQVSNTNVNPIIAVSMGSPGTVYDQRNPLEPEVDQVPSTNQTDAWRTAMDPQTELVGYGGTSYGPYTSASDEALKATSEGGLSSILTMSNMLLAGGAIIAFFLIKKFL